MAGARIVLNSRYFHIARAGEKADGKHAMTKDAAMGLVNYVGTRESVCLNVPDQISFYGKDGTPLNLDPLKLSAEVAARPATKKQKDTIYDLLKEIPEAKNSLEYQDYMNNKTIGNASQLISRAAEDGLGYAVDLGKAKNLIEYVGKRPGADRVGEHGLFSDSPDVDLQKAQEEIASCKGNIWTHVVSLRREDADALGYDHQKPWRDLVMQKIGVIAEASNIPVSELHWYAGMHNTTHHPHIHLFVFSDNPKAGKLTVEGINKMKQEFSKEIFAEERLHIYEHKTEMRDELKRKIESILSGIENHESDQFSKKELDVLCGRLLHLSHDIELKTGKHQYGYLKRDANICNQIDGIMSDLAKAPAIQRLYGLYCEDHKDLQRMYRNDPQNVTPLLEEKAFLSIKNKIIREAVKLGNAQLEVSSEQNISDPALANSSELIYNGESIKSTSENATPVYNGGYKVDLSPDESDPSSLLSDDDSLFACVPDEKPEFEPPEEYGQAAEWEPHDDFEPPAKHEAPTDFIRAESGSRTQKQAYKQDSFEECLNKAMNGNTAAKYQLAKSYFYGKGVERDYIQAQMWYGLAAKDGHAFANYELGKMYLYGIGIDKNPELGKEYCLDAYWNFWSTVEKTCGYGIGYSIDHGIKFDGDCPDADKVSYIMYCLGRMEYAGEGVERDFIKALQWYQQAADAGHIHSNYCIAKMFYGGEGVPQDYNQAKLFYKAAADGKDKYAYHGLGKMYDTGTGVEQNYSKAANWFTLASKEDAPYADYRLAQLYESGQGVEKDEELSSILYKKALDEFVEQEKQQPNAADEFRIANMYLRGLGVEVNPQEAAKWLELCVEKEDPRAQYQLARMYQDGQGIQQDEAKAQELYAASLAGFLKLEQETPASHIEYKIAGMYDRGNGTEPDAAQSYSWYVKAAEGGHPHAAYRVAKACYDGTGTDQDYKAAEQWFIKAADGADPYAMYSLGKMYRDGIGVEINAETSYSYFLAAAKLEHEFAQFAVAKALLYGMGTEQNTPEALRWFTQVAEKGNHYAEYQVAELLSVENAVPRDEVKAQNLYAEALAGFVLQEQTEPNEQLEYRIGSMYLHGKGIQKNLVDALPWFLLSANKGNSYAAYQAAELLSDRKAVPQDEVRAQKLYANALAGFVLQEQTEPNEQLEYRIGSMYLHGKGTQQNLVDALPWFLLSANKGNFYAAYQAAELLSDGKAVPQDEVRARKLYTEALTGFLEQERTEPNEQIEYRVGSMYLYGKGTQENPAEALPLFLLSADKGNAYAAYQAAELLSDRRVVPKEEVQAQKLYAEALAGFLLQERADPNEKLEYRIGSMYLYSKGTHENPTEALRWFTSSADKGNSYAAYQAAELLSDGKVVPKNEVKAQKLYAEALAGFLLQERADPNEKLEYRIGSMYFHGKGTQENPTEALRWFTSSADKGNSYVAYQAAELLSNGKVVPKDEVKAQKLYAEALAGFLLQEQNDPNEQLEYRIGSMYLHSKGTQENPTEALRWYTLSAEKGNAYAAFQAGQILEERKDMPNNEIQAWLFYNLALNGFIQAEHEKPDDSQEFRIGQMFYRGKGTIVDYTTAANWFSLSAEKGHAQAQFQLARMLQIGEGVPIDQQRSQALYFMAFQGFLTSLKEEPDSALQFKIGTMYQFGLGVEKNMGTAKQWFTTAAQAGNEYAQERLNQIEAFKTQAAVGSVLGLFRALARNMGNSINDSTTHKYRQDKKLMQKQHALKVSHGHKYDDQEQSL
jgi:TPR repeat protein